MVADSASRRVPGPALRNPASGPEQAFDDDYIDLGRLQGNLGDQNYELPPDIDPAAYASVVIWCDRFDSAFGAADLVGVRAMGEERVLVKVAIATDV